MAGGNSTVGQVWDWQVTPLRLHPSYILYYTHWTRLILTGILPFLHLLVLNAAIARSLAGAAGRGAQATYRSGAHTHARAEL